MSDIPPDLLAVPPGSLAVADAPGLPLGGPQWGIFNQSGVPILAVDSTASIEYARDYHISDYPQEKGAFMSYNKVKVPFQAKIGFLIAQTRTDFLNGVEKAVESRDFVTVVTPEIRYPSANLTHYGYRREATQGKTLIRVDVWCEEVRIVTGVVPSNPQSTNAASPTQSGQQQSQPTVAKDPVATEENPANGTENFVGSGYAPVDQSPTAIDTSNTENFVGPNTLPAGVPSTTGGNGLSTDIKNTIANRTLNPGVFTP